MAFVVFLVWIFLCSAVATVAEKKGRSSRGFFFLSLICSPLIGLITVLCVESNTSVIEAKKIASGESKKCPFCAELIKKEARACRFCCRDQHTGSFAPVREEKV